MAFFGEGYVRRGDDTVTKAYLASQGYLISNILTSNINLEFEGMPGTLLAP